jgi:hypothetical protein
MRYDAEPHYDKPLSLRLQEHVAVNQAEVSCNYVQQYRNDAVFNRLANQLADVLLSFDRETVVAALDIAVSLNKEAEVRRGK